MTHNEAITVCPEYWAELKARGALLHPTNPDTQRALYRVEKADHDAQACDDATLYAAIEATP